MKAVVRMKRIGPRTDSGVNSPATQEKRDRIQAKSQKKAVTGNKMVNGVKCYKALQQ